MGAPHKYPPPQSWYGLDEPYIQLGVLLLLSPTITAIVLLVLIFM